MTIVEINKLTKTYEQNSIKVHALSDVSVNIEAGEFTVMVGPSGSGKTVVINYALSQLEKLKVKRVLFDKDCGGEIFVRAAGARILPCKLVSAQAAPHSRRSTLLQPINPSWWHW